MNGRCLAALFTVIAVVLLAVAGVAGQTQTVAADRGSSQTPWGDPDLQGTWTNTSTTPLERPDDLAGQELLTDEERTARDEERALTADRPPPPGQTGSYNTFWFERGTLSTRTSLIVDPPDGKLPPLLSIGEDRRAEQAEARGRDPDGPEDRNLYERCISRGLPGAMMPGFYNHNYQILQTPGYVAIYVEMVHDARIIPLDGRPHVEPDIRQWLGDSRGRWEGETLVVETTNFKNVNGRGLTVFGSNEHTHLVERFTRVDADTIDYQFTLNDSTEYASPWTAAIPMTTLEGVLFEYACHEGNYAIENILAGARTAEKTAREAVRAK